MCLANVEAFDGELESRPLGEVERLVERVCEVAAAIAYEDVGLRACLVTTVCEISIRSVLKL
jgi:hypothetical protein